MGHAFKPKPHRAALAKLSIAIRRCQFENAGNNEVIVTTLSIFDYREIATETGQQLLTHVVRESHPDVTDIQLICTDTLTGTAN